MLDRDAIDRCDDFAGLQNGLVGRTAFYGGNDQRAACSLQTQGFRNFRRHRLEGRTDIRPLEALLALFRRLQENFHKFAGMAKPIPLEPPPREKIAVLMPISSPFMFINAPARVTRVDGGIRLNEEADIARRHLIAGKTGDDALVTV